MASLEIDDTTAKVLSELAAEKGLTVEAFIKSLAEQQSNGTHSGEFTDEDFESELTPLLFSGPSLPADFSRADIYTDRN